MKNKTINIFAFLFVLCMLLGIPAAHANDKIVSKILSGYNTDWQQIGLEGKLKLDGIPLGIKPSLKAYMVRDEVIRLSARAPLMGEVAVIEIDNSRILVVNKMKNRYASLPMVQVTGFTGLTVSNIQELLLARMFCVGEKKAKASAFDTVEQSANNMIAVVPKKQAREFDYGFIFNQDLSLICTLFSTSIGTLTLNYSYPGNHIYDAEILLDLGKSVIAADLEINNLTYNPKELKPFEITTKYKEVSVLQLF